MMNKRKKGWYNLLGAICFTFVILLGSCTEGQASHEKKETGGDTEISGESPFDAERAFEHIAKQVGFGPRVPNTEGHRACRAYFIEELKARGLQVQTQDVQLTAFDGTKLEVSNIIAEYAPERSERMLLFAHWDTRLWADYDPDPTKCDQPILGADDGASGPGILLEIARLLEEVGLQHIGVDIIFFDAEDYGLPHHKDVVYKGNGEETWALGTQYWTRNLHREGYAPRYGVLLDMVGSEGATFYRESFSQKAAGKEVTKVWQIAQQLGYEQFFINKMGAPITDDHYFIIKNLRIPCLDIINYDPSRRPTGFGKHWHTHQDNLEVISTSTLQAVGSTLWALLLHEDTL